VIDFVGGLPLTGFIERGDVWQGWWWLKSITTKLLQFKW